MRQADAQEAAIFFYVEAFSEIQGVVVAIPGKEATIAERGGQLQRSSICNADGKSGTTTVKFCGIGDAVELKSGNFHQSRNHGLRQASLVLLDGVVCS